MLRFAGDFAVINDSYNSNPVALRAMMELAAHTQGYRRRILAAGEMLELGSESAQLHRKAGGEAAALNFDWILGVQGNAAEIVSGAVEAGTPPLHARFFAAAAEVAEFIAAMIEPGDLVLVKGSRGVKMERVVEALRARYPLAGDKAPAASSTPAVGPAIGPITGPASGRGRD
jgi:UDP-N-acetylmuramoyl-tripeptide--D-alanyl-D-alanine ligase